MLKVAKAQRVIFVKGNVPKTVFPSKELLPRMAVEVKHLCLCDYDFLEMANYLHYVRPCKGGTFKFSFSKGKISDLEMWL